MNGVGRLLPRTLYGRLLAVLLLGLLAGQALSLWINLAERDRVMLRAAGMQPANRVADLVLLLDPLELPERERIVRVLDAPPLHVRLMDQAQALPPPPEGASFPADPLSARATLDEYRQALHRLLGEQRALEVQWAPFPPPWRGGGRLSEAERSHHEGMRHRPPGLMLVAQVQLQAGQWLRMDAAPPLDDRSLPLRMLISLGLMLLLLAGLSAWAVRRVTRPLNDLAQAADALGQDLQRPPLPDAGPQEVQRANRAFNAMQARLRHTLDVRTRMLVAMSHDLKTPLTRMRLRAEMLEDDALRERMEHDLDEMSQMVTDALDFLRGLEQAPDHRPVDVMALLESLQADQRAMGREVALAGACERHWTGDAARLRRCLGNLVDNAVLYGQRAELRVDDSPQELVLRVRDHGPGIPPDQLEQVFEPFFRLEASRNRVTGGSGLGLGIARQIAEGAGGHLVLRNHPQGGLEAVVTLPR